MDYIQPHNREQAEITSTEMLIAPEKECIRNVEVKWLLGNLVPNYHSIADFRKVHGKAFKTVFKLFVLFLREENLLGKTTVAVDGSKFRAVNSKKKNYNQKKIERHLSFIETKAGEYLEELDRIDSEENNTKEKFIRRQDIKKKLKQLKERKLNYEEIRKQVEQSDDGQVSATDAESKALIINKNHRSEKRKTGGTTQVKHYKTPHCKNCPVLSQCTKNTRGRGRVIERGQYQDTVDRNNYRMKTQRELYNRRQTICEHPFGTIKRAWGYTHTLLKGIKKVDGEMGLIFTIYNLKRVINILSTKKLIVKLKKWKPDYKLACKTGRHTLFFSKTASLPRITVIQNFSYRLAA